MGFLNFFSRIPSLGSFNFFRPFVPAKPASSYIPIGFAATLPFFALPAFGSSIFGITPFWNRSSTKTNNQIYGTVSNSSDFNKMLSCELRLEGGYANNPYDRGGATNKGITHATYDSYRKSKGLPKQSVKYITDAEVREIYYKNYYLASGADKISNRKLAFALFDTAVNMGVGAAKKLLNQSGGDYNKFNQLRRARYQQIASKRGQRRFLKGWMNRMNIVANFANQNLSGNVSYMA